MFTRKSILGVSGPHPSAEFSEQLSFISVRISRNSFLKGIQSCCLDFSALRCVRCQDDPTLRPVSQSSEVRYKDWFEHKSKNSQGRILNFPKAGEHLLKGTSAQTWESIINIHPHQFSLLRALILTHFTGSEYVQTYAVTLGPCLRPHSPLFLSQVMDAQKVRVWSMSDQSSSEWKLGGGRKWWREGCREMEAGEGGLAASC